jgi:D-lactate dehydrogenase (cytochrome)
MDRAGLYGSILGHVGDGNFHESIIFDPSDLKKRTIVQEVLHKMVHTALEMEGTCTGEHGIGLGKRDALMEELGVDTIGVMRSIKLALDPNWLMNPAKIFSHPACKETYGH